MSQQHLDRKTVLNIVYTQQATRMADAYETLLADFSQMTACGRGLESDLSHARVEISFLKAEVERLRKACELVFDESAKRKFLMCYRGNDFYVSKEAMEAMSVALGYRKAKEGKQS